MKKLLIACAVVFMLCAAASAQTPSSPISIHVGAGLSMPMAPDLFKDNWKMGFHGMGGVGYSLAPGFQIVGKIEYHTFGLDVEGADGGAFSALMFGADGRFAFGLPAAPVKPFVLAGVGMASCSIADANVDATDFYFNFGGGVEFKVGPKANLFVQARYVDVMSEGDATGFVPITAGLKFF